VILTVPASDEIDATIVVGSTTRRSKPPTGWSRTLLHHNCLAPLAKILDDAFGIEEGSSPPSTLPNDQRLADVPHKDFGGPGGGGEHHPDDDRGARAWGSAAALAGQARPAWRCGCRCPTLDRRPGLPVAGETGVAEINGRSRRRAGPPRGSSSTARWRWSPRTSSATPTPRSSDALSTHAGGDGYAKVIACTTTSGATRNRVVDLIRPMMAVGSSRR